MLVRGLYRHFNSRAVACRGMPFCPCYLRVDLRPSPGLCCLCVGANTRTARDIRPQPAGAKISAARLADPHPACRHGHAGPGRTAVPPQRSAPADPPAPDHTHAWEGPPRPGETFHHASTLARPWAATHAVPTAHHPRLRIAKRNACSASQSHAERRLRAAGSGLGSSVRRLADQPVLALPGRPHCPAGAGDGGAEATCDTREPVRCTANVFALAVTGRPRANARCTREHRRPPTRLPN